MKKRSSRDFNVSRPNRLRVTIPERVSPHVKLVFSEMQRQGVMYDDLVWKSGVQRAAIKGWRTKNTPMLTSLEAVLGSLGWDFVPIPRAEAIPPEIETKLRPIADELGISMAQTMRFLIEIVANIRQRTGSPHPCDLAA